MEKMILIPYKEYLSLIASKNINANQPEQAEDRDYSIYYQKLFGSKGERNKGFIGKLEITVRVYNCLLNNYDDAYLADLVQESEAQLRAMYNFGKSSLNQLKESCQQFETANNLKQGTLRFGQKLPSFVNDEINRLRVTDRGEL